MHATQTYPYPMDDRRTRFVDLMAANAGILHKVAATYAWTPEDRADLIQDIQAAVWEAWPRYDANRPFATWMYRVALNVAISQVRQTSRHRKHHVAFDPEMHDVAAPAQDNTAQQQMDALKRVLDSLDVYSRALLVMHLDDLSHKDIAEVLGISESNVSTKLNRIKQRLKSLHTQTPE